MPGDLRHSKHQRVTLAAMKRLVLLLLACLMLVLPAVAQALQKAAADDLVVTAEIVGYSKFIIYPSDFSNPVSRRKLRRYLKQPSKEYAYRLNAKMVVRNTTVHPREINMMDCDWPRSWVASGTDGFFEPTWQPGCDKNSPISIEIPAGEAIIFMCPLELPLPLGRINATTGNPDNLDYYLNYLPSLKLGFMDLSLESVTNGFYGMTHEEDRILAKMRKARAVYWANLFTNTVKADTLKELTGEDSRLIWGVTWVDKYWGTFNDR